MRINENAYTCVLCRPTQYTSIRIHLFSFILIEDILKECLLISKSLHVYPLFKEDTIDEAGGNNIVSPSKDIFPLITPNMITFEIC